MATRIGDRIEKALGRVHLVSWLWELLGMPSVWGLSGSLVISWWAHAKNVPAPMILVLGLVSFGTVLWIWRQLSHLWLPQGAIGEFAVLRAVYGVDESSDIDVTSWVRSCIKGGRIENMLVCNATFGGRDPYPTRPKHLTIRYVYQGRRFEIVRGEGDTFTLPEIPQQSQSAPAVSLNPTQRRVQDQVTAKFLGLKLVDKLALKRISDAGSIEYDELWHGLEADGFTDGQAPIARLQDLDFLEITAKTLILRNPEWIAALLRQYPIS